MQLFGKKKVEDDELDKLMRGDFSDDEADSDHFGVEEGDVDEYDGDGEVEVEGAEGEPVVEVSEAVRFCETACEFRETCGTRLSFKAFAVAHRTVSQHYPADLAPNLDILLEQGVEPFMDALEGLRDNCANEKFALEGEALHQQGLIMQLRPEIASMVTAAMREVLPGIVKSLRHEVGDAVKAELESARRVPVVESSPPRVSVQAKTNGKAATVVQVEGGGDESVEDDVASLVADARQKFPEDDADACRYLFKTTKIGVAELTKAFGQKRMTIHSWKANPKIKAGRGLNDEMEGDEEG